MLRSVRPLEEERVVGTDSRGGYLAGRVGDREIPAYVDEDGVAPGAAQKPSPRWS